ncbi:hypothetical protein L905_14125 [Agrobacterium sp. TS43]|nr:hypothetical protein L906_01805 [Agrobacterium sp. TS45]KVK68676.1 hypothetical protein L907_01815 [Agrobacterium sp. C13]KVK69384.1 hypothetical protein L905_14125 [Agrobacterium sp. TS43]
MGEGFASAVVADRLAEEAGADEDFGGGVGQSKTIPASVEAENTPLCPAGHLPLKGGDRQEEGSPQKFARLEVIERLPRFDLPP